MNRRGIDIAIISDCHLGTRQCRAADLLAYLDSIDPQRLIINGDFFDITMGRSKFYGEDQHKVISRILEIAEIAQVDYITGNHDIALRRYHHMIPGPINVTESLDVLVNGRKYLVIHGDQFEGHSGHWLSRKLAALIYDSVMLADIYLAPVVNWFRRRRRTTAGLVSTLRDLTIARKYLTRFHQSTAQYAADHGYQGICCGHVHETLDEMFITSGGQSIHCLNSGDWCSHATALELVRDEWAVVTVDEPVGQLEEMVSPELIEECEPQPA